MLENKFKTQLIKDVKNILPNCEVLEAHLSPTERQGIPDLVFFVDDSWFMLEGKRDSKSVYQKNQQYYIDKANRMSYCAEIDPENKEEILNEIQQKFGNRK